LVTGTSLNLQFVKTLKYIYSIPELTIVLPAYDPQVNDINQIYKDFIDPEK
jgi:hypothetical protein